MNLRVVIVGAIERVLKECLGRIIVSTGLHRRALRRTAVVAAFHSVTKDVSDGALRCARSDFQKYCDFFAKHMRPLSLSALVECLCRRDGAFDAAVCVTFDDGYADNVHAAAALARRRVPALFYVTTDFIGSDTQAFWDRNAGIESCWMSWGDVRELIEAGHEIGAHTMTHADLSLLTLERVEHELAGSRDAIVAQVGVPPTHFAVPFGRAFDSLGAVAGIATRCGFKSVSLCRGGVVVSTSDVMRIERWPIDPRLYLSPYGWIVDVIREAKATRAADGSRVSQNRSVVRKA